jgi:hypothetical protein
VIKIVEMNEWGEVRRDGWGGEMNRFERETWDTNIILLDRINEH